ncbi:hypothetical protein DICVIV_09170 [Dictyocaulus viviparus]|uniref:Uncharacterized protein n=1 Tax=Dictyocaulus viviparus TaxID=29172 RepID=A0A0D8XJQ4_DICVI|nr:hypothetical protein DICVIV_09170 [Dictyocaulus viviparus]
MLCHSDALGDNYESQCIINAKEYLIILIQIQWTLIEHKPLFLLNGHNGFTAFESCSYAVRRSYKLQIKTTAVLYRKSENYTYLVEIISSSSAVKPRSSRSSSLWIRLFNVFIKLLSCVLYCVRVVIDSRIPFAKSVQRDGEEIQ